MIYKTITDFFENLINNEINEDMDKFALLGSVSEVTAYFRLLFVRSGQGAFYNVLNSYVKNNNGLKVLLLQCYDLYKNGKLDTKEVAVAVIVKSIINDDFLKKFDKEAKNALPPIIAIFFAPLYKGRSDTNWLVETRKSVVDIPIGQFEDLIRISKQKSLGNEGLLVCEDLIVIREEMLGEDTEKLEPIYSLLATEHEKMGLINFACTNCEKIIKIHEKNGKLKDENVVVMCDKVGGMYERRAYYTEALQYYKKAINSIKLIHGEDSLPAGIALEKLAKVYIKNNEYPMSIEAKREAAQIYESSMSIENTETIRIYEELIENQMSVRDFGGAYESLNKIFGVIKVINGARSESAISSMILKANICRKLCKYDEMDEIFKECLDLLDALFARKHYLVGDIYSSIAKYNIKQGKYKDALDLFQNSMDIYKEFLGEDDDRTINMNEEIASVYEEMEEYKTAKHFYEKTIEEKAKKQKKDDVEILDLKEKLANVIRLDKNLPKAEEILKEVLTTKERIFPQRHMGRVSIYFNKGLLCRDLKEVKQSINYFEIALEMAEKTLYPENEIFIKIHEQLAYVYQEDQDLVKSKEHFDEMLRRREKNGDYLEMAKSYQKLAQGENDNLRYDKAIEYADKALELLLKVYKDDSIELLETISLQGMIHNESGNTIEAIKKFEGVAEVITREYGSENYNLVTAYQNICGVQMKRESYDAIIALLDESLRISKLTYGESAQETGQVYANIAFVNYLQGDVESSLVNYEKYLQISKGVRPRGFGINPEIYLALGKKYDGYGDNERAIAYYKRCLKLFEKADRSEIYEDSKIDSDAPIRKCYVLEKSKKYDEAFEAFKEYVDSRISIENSQSIGNGEIYKLLSQTYKKLGKEDLATLYEEKSAYVVSRSLGEFHESLIDFYVKKAKNAVYNANYDIAFSNLEKAMYITEKSTDKEVYTGILKYETGCVNVEINELNLAIDNFVDALEILNKYPDAPQIHKWKTLNQLGTVYMIQNKFEEALENFQKCDEMCSLNDHEDKKCSAINYHNFADVYMKLKSYSEAIKYYELALKIRINIFGENNFLTGCSYVGLGDSYRANGDINKSLDAYTKALDSFNQSIGVEHNNYKYVVMQINALKILAKEHKERIENARKRLVDLIRGY